MYNNKDNMNVLFNIQKLNNINVQNDDLLNVDSDHSHDFQLPNCINVDPNHLLINRVSATTFSCWSFNIFSLKKYFQTLIIIIIYHGFLPTPRRGSHVKSDKTHIQSSRYTP